MIEGARPEQADEGFTLIELLVVIVILGILAAITVFSVQGITDRGSRSACQANLETINIASEAYRTQNSTYATNLVDLQTAGFIRTFPAPLSGNSMTVTNPGGTSYTITYSAGLATATGGCPAGASGGGGGGGGGGPACAFGAFDGRTGNSTTRIQMSSGGTASGTGELTLTGDCSAITGIVLYVNKDDDGSFPESGEGPWTMVGSGNTWTIAWNSTGSGWNDDETMSARIIVTGGTIGTVPDFTVQTDD